LGLWDPCAPREGNRCGLLALSLGKGFPPARCGDVHPLSAPRMAGCQGSQWRSLGVLPSAWGALQDSSHPLTPLPQPPGVPWLAALERPKSLFPPPALRMLGGICTCWPLPDGGGLTYSPPRVPCPRGFQGSISRPNSLACRTKDSCNVRFPSINPCWKGFAARHITSRIF